MAIAFVQNSTVTNQVGTTHSVTPTFTSGSNMIGLVWVEQGTIALGDPTGITWDGVAMTKINTFTTGTARLTLISLWGILAPATGSKNITATFASSSNSNLQWATYSGVSQSDAISSLQNSTNGTVGAATSTGYITTALTPSNANSWIAAFGIDLASSFTVTGGTTQRYWGNWSIVDSGGTVSGSTTLGATLGSSSCWGNNAVVLIPVSTGSASFPRLSLMGVGR